MALPKKLLARLCCGCVNIEGGDTKPLVVSAEELSNTVATVPMHEKRLLELEKRLQANVFRTEKLFDHVIGINRRTGRSEEDIEIIEDWIRHVTELNPELRKLRHGECITSEVPDSESDKGQIQQPCISSSNAVSFNSCYNMNHDIHGECIIFSHEFYKKGLGVDNRKCAQAERDRIEQTFKQRGFNVTIHKDKTWKNIKRILNKLKRKDFTKDDCIVIFILSHGKENGYIWAHDKYYDGNIFEDTLSDIKSLVNKPKMMFIQACRGHKADKGISVTDVSTSESDDETDYQINRRTTPIKADFFIAHCTAEGFLSYREWFIPVLCETIDVYGDIYDMDEILLQTTNEVCKMESVSREERKDKAKQVPTIKKTLRRKLYLKKS